MKGDSYARPRTARPTESRPVQETSEGARQGGEGRRRARIRAHPGTSSALEARVGRRAAPHEIRARRCAARRRAVAWLRELAEIRQAHRNDHRRELVRDLDA